MALFEIDESSGLPVWVQLRNRFVYLIKTGHYQPGDQLPSVRTLAAEAAINYNTVSKVYINLEHDGYVESVRGRGVFVRDIGKLAADDVQSIADTEIEESIKRCLALGMTLDEIMLRMIDVAHRVQQDVEGGASTSQNGSLMFSAFVFVVALVLAIAAGYLITGAFTVWVVLVGFALACLAEMSIHIAMQWEKVVVLRFGKFSRSKGPGLYFTIPFIEQTALKADQRIMVTGFGAEETLTSDLVPINVDAVLFWMVWDAEKACLEVENYYNSVSLVAQTALRDAIGRASVSEVAIRRNQLDQELQEVIEERTSLWGITVLSVEIRDIVIPQELQEVMSTEAQAEREKNARMVLAEVEKDISSMLVDAAHVYEENEVALRLRTMHLLYESVKGSGGTVVIPSAYSEGFSDAALKNMADSLKTPK